MSLNINNNVSTNFQNPSFKGLVRILKYKEGKEIFDESYKISKSADQKIKAVLAEKFTYDKLTRLDKSQKTDDFHSMIENLINTKVENVGGDKFLYINKFLDVVLFGDYDKLKVIPQNGVEFMIDFLV